MPRESITSRTIGWKAEADGNPPSGNASSRFVENGKPAAASELKTGERATVNFSPREQRVAIRIAISPGGKPARAHKTPQHTDPPARRSERTRRVSLC